MWSEGWVGCHGPGLAPRGIEGGALYHVSSAGDLLVKLTPPRGPRIAPPVWTASRAQPRGPPGVGRVMGFWGRVQGGRRECITGLGLVDVPVGRVIRDKEKARGGGSCRLSELKAQAPRGFGSTMRKKARPGRRAHREDTEKVLRGSEQR